MDDVKVDSSLAIAGLIHRKRSGVLTPSEEQLLTVWILEKEGNQALYDELISTNTIEKNIEVLFSKDLKPATDKVYNAIGFIKDEKNENPSNEFRFFKSAWLRYAAIVLLVAGAGVYWYHSSSRKNAEIVKSSIIKEKQDIEPAGNKAILTLADGTTIILDSAANGSLAHQGNTKILKLDAGKLSYKGGSASGEVLYNAISTPKGGQYQIELPDGSEVWLNAASSIRFPTAFIKERKVTITGEAYFEIAADKNKPFEVSANGETIEVLGTSFNINAYKEGHVRTSLKEGLVRINNTILKPGYAFSNGKLSAANLDQDLAWKNGLFNFEGANVLAIMREIERWYDVKVVYKNVPNIVFIGEVPRDISLSKLLKILEEFGVHSQLDADKKEITILR